MRTNESFSGLTQDTLAPRAEYTLRSKIARWAIGLALAGGLGIGVASAQVVVSHAPSAAHAAHLVSVSPDNVTGGPGNG
ncbi:MAG TPA: hypothetical protein VJN88_17195 [Ktedonobacterales bacterium]|nr:hypothetical protein [Ktedonobacterales bacterium]